MSIELFIYLADMLDAFVKNVAGVVIMVLLFWLFYTAVVQANFDSYIGKERPKIKYRTPVSCLVVIVLMSFIPTKQTMYMIAGVHFGKEAIQSDAALKAYNLLNKYLDEQLNEITKNDK